MLVHTHPRLGSDGWVRARRKDDVVASRAQSQEDHLMNERTWFPLTGPVPRSRGLMAASRKKPGPVDPLTGPPLALAGRIVTMNDTFAVRADAIVYIEKGVIVGVQDRPQPPPDSFAGVPVVETGGTIFPGLIELHNHLSYNALPLWSPVPKRFEHRGQWPNHKDYRPLVSGPMTVVGLYQDAQGHFPLLPPLVRYIECKCLLGGVTTSLYQPGREAREQRRHSALLSRHRAQCGADR
jgi:5-methylthioadenosine/S-adenosylhomocysteine deaminase